jgi:hypothetical protein
MLSRFGLQGNAMLRMLFLLVALPGCGNDSSPVVFERGFVVESRADIAALATRGGSAYVINGDLQIVGSDLATLAGLEGLRRVEGSVEIWFNDEMQSLAGLEGLESVGAGLGPAGILSSASSAGKTAHVVEGFLIFENRALCSLAGLQNLAFVGGGLSIVNNHSLGSLAALERLQRIDGSLDIWFNGALASLAGLQNLVSVRDVLEVSGNGLLASLDGLRSVAYVGADVIVSNNALLPDSAVEMFVERMVADGFSGAVVVEGNLAD